MKVVCIKEQFNRNGKFPYTVGRIYEVTRLIDNINWGLVGSYFAISDDGTEKVAYKECFIVIDEHRQQQLDKLGI